MLLGFVASILELKEDQAISGNLITLTELRASKSLNPQNQTRDPVKSLSMFQCPMGRLGFVFFFRESMEGQSPAVIFGFCCLLVLQKVKLEDNVSSKSDSA